MRRRPARGKVDVARATGRNDRADETPGAMVDGAAAKGAARFRGA